MANPNRTAGYSSSEASHLARGWLRECKNTHKRCNEPITITQFTLPRRLICIGEPGSKAPFLVETASLEEKSHRYAALSHRWGDPSKLLQTTSSTLKMHYDKIPWDAIPQTFRDAIIVAQDLSLQYLWIDSLCIIQKDRMDFEAECSQMHLIYLHCHVMIAASDSNDSSEGFLHRWDGFDKSASPTLVPNSKVTTGIPAFCPQAPHFRHNGYIKGSKWLAALDGTLNKRGWAYQERQLAPRILHYTRSGIIWECRKCIGAGDLSKLQIRGSACSLQDSRLVPQEKFLPREKMFRILDQEKSGRNVDHLMQLWLSIAEEYSMRDLSHFEDKLPALSGLAAAIVSLAGGGSVPEPPVYLAGVWLSHIHRQLLWCPTVPYDCESEEQLSQGAESLPSWSWTSCRVPVTYNIVLKQLGHFEHPSGDELCYRDAQNFRPYDAFRYLSTNISPEGSDLLGRIRGKALYVHGSYLDAKNYTITSSKENNMYKFADKGLKLDLLFDCKRPNLKGLGLRFLFLVTNGHNHCGIILSRVVDIDAFRRIGIFCVPYPESYFSKSPGVDVRSAEMTLI